eukprot:Nitzschia sp. Nitz4//scaffold125_size66327//16752//18365//NITZ4_006127-RA/size66327-processed-gene-0.12-mRNA-1//1//CDS//3329534601//1126//frame0
MFTRTATTSKLIKASALRICRRHHILSTTRKALPRLFETAQSPSESKQGFRFQPLRQFSADPVAVDNSEGVVTAKLNALIEKGEVQPDDHQLRAVTELDRVYEALMANDPPKFKPSAVVVKTTASDTSEAYTTTMSLFGGLFGTSAPAAAAKVVDQVSEAVNPPMRGTYMFGGVGCGKTFMMNLFYDSVDSGPWANDKQKVHYHKFMLQVHQHMHEQRKLDPNGDLIAPVVDQILKQGRLLCLDEFQVTDVADALILQRLFEGLWKQGCVLIATSNRKPTDLYLNGLQRDRFIPFIHLLEKRCVVVDLLDSETDYRMLANAAMALDDSPEGEKRPRVYMTKGQGKDFRKLFYTLTEGHAANPTSLETQGRRVPIPMGCVAKRVAYFDFDDLCKKALGAADYLVIANNFSTVFCGRIPKLSINELNWLRRFITFVDSMYELKVKLVLHTQVKNVDEIFVVEGNKEDYIHDEVFAFDRTRSRLEEMSSPKYLQSKWLGGGSPAKVSTTVAISPSLDDHKNLQHEGEEPVEAPGIPTKSQ